MEVGGTEQKFNILMGRTLQGAYENEQQVGLFMPILTGLDGVNKMSKSLGNYVGITEPPSEMFGKLMSISDGQMREYFELCTDVDMEEVKGLLDGIAVGSVHPMDVKKRLAREIISLYHSGEAALAAQQEFERVFSQKDTPQDMPSFEIAPDKLEGGRCSLMTIVQESGLVGTNSEIRRLISSGAISLDGVKYTDFKEMIAVSGGMVIKAGKRKFARLVMK